MADGENIQAPNSVNTEEIDLKTVKVKLLIPGFEVKKPFFGKATPKPQAAEANVKFEEMGLEVTAKTIKGGNVTNYHYKVNKLPGPIKTDSEVEYKKGMIVLTLIKTEEGSWAVQLNQNGLDQAPSD